jgi:ABC-type transport system involved in multi-copper enzyme maturation permease subunit
MSIYLPDYSRPPPTLLPRGRRIQAILSAEVRARSRAINLVVLALIFVVVVLPVVLEFYLFSLLGPTGLLQHSDPLPLFNEPFAIVAWPFFLVLLASSVGAAIVAGDLATRSITLYLSRPITPADYLVAKAGAVGVWLALGTILPGLVATAIVLALGYVSLWVALQAAAGFLLVGILGVVALTGLTVLLSALASRSTYAGAGIFGTLIGTLAIAAALSGVSGNAAFLYVSPIEDLLEVARAVFALPTSPLDPWIAGGALLGLGLVSLGIAYLRLSRTEVVAE